VNNELLKQSLELWERLEESNLDRRTSLQSQNNYLLDVSRQNAANKYRRNWDGCRDLWKSDYRGRKERRMTRS